MAAVADETQQTPAEVVARGKEIYDRDIRAQVETPENIGKLLTVDILSGAWSMGADRIEMGRRIRADHPNAVLYGLRIGYPVTEKIGRWPRPKDQEKTA